MDFAQKSLFELSEHTDCEGSDDTTVDHFGSLDLCTSIVARIIFKAKEFGSSFIKESVRLHSETISHAFAV